MKFKLDENLPWILKKTIESKGNHQVDSVYHENLCGIEDNQLVKHCLKEKRILITLDQDFENEILHDKKSTYGIIILKQFKQGKKAVNELFMRFLSSFKIEDAIGKKIIVEPTNIKILD
ncbi:MAG: DUF5615 family PIN-like protein [Promethearchaeota archaeon]